MPSAYEQTQKINQREALFALAAPTTPPSDALEMFMQSVRQAMLEDSHAFEDETFDRYMNTVLKQCNISETEKIIYKYVSARYASIAMLQPNIKDNPEETYEEKLKTQLRDILDIKEKIHDFYNHNSSVTHYKKEKKRLEQTKQEALNNLEDPQKISFFKRQFGTLGYSTLGGSLVGLTIGLTLIATALPPVFITLVALGTATMITLGIAAIPTYINEQKHKQHIQKFQNDVDAIDTSYNQQCISAEQALQEAIHPNIFLTSLDEPEHTVISSSDESQVISAQTVPLTKENYTSLKQQEKDKNYSAETRNTPNNFTSQ